MLPGCSDATSVQSTVSFKIDAPFCGGSLNRYEFLVDGTVIGDETLVNKQTSKPYAVTNGPHTIAGRLYHAGVPLMETIITVRPQAPITLDVPLYCS